VRRWPSTSSCGSTPASSQYFPRGTDLTRHGRDELTAVALALNSRPRKTLGWRTPTEALDDHLLACAASQISLSP
jgi:hypothetical protein